MKIRLGLPQEPYWITLFPGVRHRVRPASTLIVSTLKAKASRLAVAALEPDEAERLAGMCEGRDLSEEDRQQGFFRLYLAILTAQAATLDWEGYEDADGKPVPVTDDNVAEAMRMPLLSERWLEKYFELYVVAAEEGNGSGLSLNGTSTGALPIARAVVN